MTTPDQTQFHFYNYCHIGDNILNLKFFLYISSILKKKHIKINYYYNTEWPYNKLDTLRAYVDPDIVTLKSMKERPSNAILLWMGNSIKGIDYFNFEHYFELFYANILKHMMIVEPSIVPSLWLEEPFLDTVYETLDSKYKDIDILILNNTGSSGQYNNNSPLLELTKHLHNRFNIVSSVYINDDIKTATNLSLIQIGAISTHTKYIISTWSSPNVPCMNNAAKTNVRHWFFVTDMKITFTSIKCTYANNATMNNIKDFFDALTLL